MTRTTKLSLRRMITLAGGALLAAGVMILLLSAPGFLSDRDSTVSLLTPHTEVGR